MHKPHPPIQFHFLQRCSLPNRGVLKGCLVSLFRREHKKLLGLSYVFCSDDYLLALNRDFLQHDTLTDILTFEMTSVPGRIEGEIYISVDRVRENAKLYNSSVANELRRVIFHGALHLAGYLDKSQGDQATMRKKEDEYLRLFAKSST